MQGKALKYEKLQCWQQKQQQQKKKTSNKMMGLSHLKKNLS